MPIDHRRRRLLVGLGAAAGGLLAGPAAAALAPTPPQPAGPFYPQERPLDDDNDLTQVRGAEAPARGEVVELQGRLLDADGAALGGARIEIWQCDANGRYRHPWERGEAPIDPGFQGFGHHVADAEGRYRFRTIRPVAYPGRTPHIHVAVFREGKGEPFVTQLYDAAATGNDQDFLFRRVPDALRARLLMDLQPSAQGPALARLDIVVA
jgi:protocatechuate 3,4-dioxygenase beta subunit